MRACGEELVAHAPEVLPDALLFDCGVRHMRSITMEVRTGLGRCAPTACEAFRDALHAAAVAGCWVSPVQWGRCFS